MCSGSEAGSDSRLIDFVSLNSRLESNKEEEDLLRSLAARAETALQVFSSSLLLSSLELSDAQVYEP